MQWRQRIAIIVTALLVLGGLVWGFMPRPVTVEVHAAARRPMQVTVTAEGRTRVIDRYVVSAPVAAYVRRIELEVGDGVAQGAVLARLEPARSADLDPRSRAEAKARVASARAALQSAEEAAAAAEADADLARKVYARKEALCDTGCVSEQEKDIARAEMRSAAARLRSARFNVEVAGSELAAAQATLEYAAAAGDAEPVQIRAPVDGQVLAVHRESEGSVGEGEPLLELGDPRTLEVAVDVLSADAVRIQPGMAVRFERWGGASPLEGTVRKVEPVGFTKVSALGVEEQRVWVIADLTSPYEDWRRLGDGYRVEASFVLWEASEVLQIPNSALFRANGDWAVFTLAEGRAGRRTVTIGHRNARDAEVVAGLEPGTMVVLHPSDQVGEGTRVRPRR